MPLRRNLSDAERKKQLLEEERRFHEEVKVRLARVVVFRAFWEVPRAVQGGVGGV